MLDRALEEFAVGQHGKAGGASRCVALCNRSRVEVFAQHAARRTSALDLADHRRAARGQLRPERAGEIARRRLGARTRRDGGLAEHLLCGRDLGALGFQDALEDVHAAFSFCVNCTNSSSLRFASPLWMTWRARSMPSLNVLHSPEP